MTRGILLLITHLALILALAGKAQWDRRELPRVWVRAMPVDPATPLRGRYVRIQIPVEVQPSFPVFGQASLSISDGHLLGTLKPPNEPGTVEVRRVQHEYVLAEPLAFFVPENVSDPSRRQKGEELWVEVSVPPQGVPRPVRLGIRRDGPVVPLDLR